VSEQFLNGTAAQLGFTGYSAIHVDILWKIQDRRQIKNRHTTKTKQNPEKANNTKYSKTKLAWFSCLIRHSARKWRGLSTMLPSSHVFVWTFFSVTGTAAPNGGRSSNLNYLTQ